MRVLIHFTPDDGKPQTLYADMTQQAFEEYQEVINGPDPSECILYIDSRVKRNGPTTRWMFRASRTRLEVER